VLVYLKRLFCNPRSSQCLPISATYLRKKNHSFASPQKMSNFCQKPKNANNCDLNIHLLRLSSHGRCEARGQCYDRKIRRNSGVKKSRDFQQILLFFTEWSPCIRSGLQDFITKNTNLGKFGEPGKGKCVFYGRLQRFTPI
jgi:hypothetical protein